ncbi:MAG TPA: pyruvate kinase [Candidatus Acidoferrales bacterium]|nr:pyruvate kinase [Candidatus Acidoferrales bacterium]
MSLYPVKRTKIVCTIGPASQSEKVIRSLIRAGMDVARLNFSHGDFETHRRVIKTIRRVARELDKPVAILQDLPGPKIRIGPVAGERVRLRSGKTFSLTRRKLIGNEQAVSVEYSRFPRLVKKGDLILLGDGEIELEALRVGADEVYCKVVVGGVLGSRKGIHLPHRTINLPSLTEQDKRALAFGLQNGVDLIAISFVRQPKDIAYARAHMRRLGTELPIIAKIEKHEALEHMEAILNEVDGLMVARGDLGLEIPPERIPALQKLLIRMANNRGKPVITATQMLRSMVQSPRPTRAEVADVANAILDGTDALMLSEESAVGSYPSRAVETMAKIAVETERSLEPRYHVDSFERTIPVAISHAAASLARELQLKAFLVPTSSGSTARLIARHRPLQPILALSPNPKTVQSLCLVWGVYPFRVRNYQTIDAMIRLAQHKALELGMVKKGDLVGITAGLPLHQAGTTNMITVKPVE